MLKAINYWLENNLYAYDFVLLLPEMNEKIKSKFLDKLKSRKGCIITGDEAKELVELYSLYEFSGNVIVGSFDEPYGRKLRNILNCEIASEETIIDDIILGAMND
jgi:hypothetical protein